jgi:hypothetical protein
MRLTVDTAEDYERCQVLWEALGEGPGGEASGDEAVIAAYRRLAGAGHPLFAGQETPPAE